MLQQNLTTYSEFVSTKEEPCSNQNSKKDIKQQESSCSFQEIEILNTQYSNSHMMRNQILSYNLQLTALEPVQKSQKLM